MAPNPAQYSAYRRATHTVGKTRQVVMLYDGVISALQQARDAMAERRIEDRYNLLTKATQILMGLQSSLDFASGHDVAAILYDFYSRALFTINTLQRDNDMAKCGELIEEIKSMRIMWDEIDREESASASPAAAPPQESAPATAETGDPAPPTPAGGLSVSA
jgi:flagellar protein FliS